MYMLHFRNFRLFQQIVLVAYFDLSSYEKPMFLTVLGFKPAMAHPRPFWCSCAAQLRLFQL